jgi:31-O-methyltransferase
MERVTLPDGRAVWAVSAFETKMIYREIVTMRVYDGHGITLGPGAQVFDVGANIGLYALHLAGMGSGIRVRCFEPIPSTFDILKRNLDEHAPGVTAVPAGLGAADGDAIFSLDRHASIGASMQPGVFAPVSIGSIGEWVTAGVADVNRVEPHPLLRFLQRRLERRWSRPLVIAALAPVVAGLEIRRRRHLTRLRCAIRSLSAELAASGFDHLDLVKIDVEGAEEDVLKGIDERDWPRIRQFVIEVHDVDGRLERMAAQLTERGYHVTHDREDWASHRLWQLSTIYAARR